MVDKSTRRESPHHRTACLKLRFASRYSLQRLENPPLSHRAIDVPLREAPPLALSGIFEQGNFPCYNRTTVQAGMPMTVKEMRLAAATQRAFSFGRHAAVCDSARRVVAVRRRVALSRINQKGRRAAFHVGGVIWSMSNTRIVLLYSASIKPSSVERVPGISGLANKFDLLNGVDGKIAFVVTSSAS
jgi:hypothetical protein